jgi:uncharacterized protein YbaR (Trm112 family)
MVTSKDYLICPYCKEKHDLLQDVNVPLADAILHYQCKACNRWFDVEQQIDVIYITMKRE